MNKKNFSMTKCTKTGIKIKDSGNDYKHDPFDNMDPFQFEKSHNPLHQYQSDQYETLNLNIDDYSREELYRLFGLSSSAVLTEENMRHAKKIVLKTHPDKSRLENKYFVFFSSAYKRLYQIYQFQHKCTKSSSASTDYEKGESEYYDAPNKVVLDKMFDMKTELKNPNQFNQWFNAQFEKHRIDDPIEHGYGDWLKTDEDIVYTPQHINKDAMGREMDKRKKELQQLTPYTGINYNMGTSSVVGSSLMEYNNNFSSVSSNNSMGYTDLKQAYVESVIPVTDDDFHKVQKFKSVNEYKQHRDNANLKPLSKEEAMMQLFNQNKTADEESAALAFYYAKQLEKANNSSTKFWSELKQLTHV